MTARKDEAIAYTTDHPEVLEQAERTGSDPAAIASAMRTSAAIKEARALKEWQRTCEGPSPATPNLTAIREGITMPKSTKSASTPKAQRAVDYTKDGVTPVRSRPWSIGYVAAQCTAGIGGKDVKAIKTAELVAILHKLGVKDVNAPFAEVTLPNGIRIGAVAVGTAPTAKPAPKKSTPLVPSPKARTARKTAATKAKTAARKSSMAKAS